MSNPENRFVLLNAAAGTLTFELLHLEHFYTQTLVRGRVAAWIDEYNLAQKGAERASRWERDSPPAMRRHIAPSSVAPVVSQSELYMEATVNADQRTGSTPGADRNET